MYLKQKTELKQGSAPEKSYTIHKKLYSFIKQNNITPDENEVLIIKEHFANVSLYFSNRVRATKRKLLVFNIIIIAVLLSVILYYVLCNPPYLLSLAFWIVIYFFMTILILGNVLNFTNIKKLNSEEIMLQMITIQ